MKNRYFEFINSTKINCGENALETICQELEQRGSISPILLGSADSLKVGAVDKVLSAIDGTNIKAATVYADIAREVSTETINAIRKMYTDGNCDGILAVGGSAVINAAKALRLLISQDKENLSELAGHMAIKKMKYVPFVVVPSAVAAGNEVTCIASIANSLDNKNMEFASHELLPDVAIIDVRITEHTPARVTAAAGLESLSIAIEAYSCAKDNPIVSTYAATSVKLIADSLTIAVKNGADTNARINMATGATFASIAFSNTLTGNIQAIGSALAKACDITKSEAVSILTPFCMEYNMSACSKYYSDILLYLGGAELYAGTEEAARAALTVRIIRDTALKCREMAHLPCRLSETNAAREKFGEVADKALDEVTMITCPKTMSKQDVLDILNKAY